MRNCLVILLLLFLSSCGIYKYEYKGEGMRIVSKKGNPITRVIIKTEEGKELAQFESISGKPSKEFSLKDFSTDKFKCINGCPFNFENGNIYLINVSPVGDRMLLPIKIKVEPNGSIVELKH